MCISVHKVGNPSPKSFHSRSLADRQSKQKNKQYCINLLSADADAIARRAVAYLVNF
ncbi:MAG: hypothetical protein LBU34_18205 [Planctomycetaceae bacterium]|nr:hypothetical protein [Planctomycetaceae bacterium]